MGRPYSLLGLGVINVPFFIFRNPLKTASSENASEHGLTARMALNHMRK